MTQLSLMVRLPLVFQTCLREVISVGSSLVYQPKVTSNNYRPTPGAAF
ncbi:MAG: hypothetical protein V7K83_22655 [Nostoc sp.]